MTKKVIKLSPTDAFTSRFARFGIVYTYDGKIEVDVLSLKQETVVLNFPHVTGALKKDTSNFHLELTEERTIDINIKEHINLNKPLSRSFYAEPG